MSTPEIAFTGDTTSDFILDPHNSDVLAAKILVAEVFRSNLLSLVTLHLISKFALQHVTNYIMMALTASRNSNTCHIVDSKTNILYCRTLVYLLGCLYAI